MDTAVKSGSSLRSTDGRLEGQPTRYPSQETRYATKYSKLYRCGYRLKVPALGYQRRIQALMAIGWSLTEIGKRARMTKGQLSTIIRPAVKDNRKMLYLSTAKKIEAVFKELHLQPRHDLAAMKVKTWAKKRGYAPPAAWDDIDDETETPKGVEW